MSLLNEGRLLDVTQRSAAVVIAAADSPNFAKWHADVVCPGAADQVTINAAIASLPARGGKVVLRVGNYILTAPVVIDGDFVTLEGEVHPMWGGYAGTWPIDDIEGFGCAKLKQTTSGADGIRIQNANVTNTDPRHRGIAIRSLYLFGSGKTGTAISTAPGAADWCSITDNFIHFFASGIAVTLDSPIIRDNSIQNIGSGTAISLGAAGNYGLVTGNLIYDSSCTGINSAAFGTIVSDNVLGDLGVDGIVTSGRNSVVSGNTFERIFGTPIKVSGRSTIVQGNAVDATKNGGSQNTTSDGVQVSGVGSTVTGNTFYNNASSTGFAINLLAGANGCAVSGNAIAGGGWNAGSATTVRWGTGANVGTAIGLNSGDNATATVVTVSGPATVSSGTVTDWYKADTLALANGAAVTSWADSGSSRYVTSSATAPTFVTAAANGQPCVRFTAGTNCTLKNTTSPSRTQPATYFVVARQTAAQAQVSLLNGGYTPGVTSGAGTHALFLSSSGVFNGYAGTALADGTATTAAAHVFEVVINGASSLAGVDGTTTSGNAGAGNANGGIVLAGNQAATAEFFGGDIFEVVVYTGALSTADRSAVRSALGTKYGIAVV